MPDGLLTSKVLVYERDNQKMNVIKTFLKENNLHGLRTNREENIVSILKAHIDLGCIIICEIDENYLNIARDIRGIRRELPIFLRRNKDKLGSPLCDECAPYFDGVFCSEQMEDLQKLVDKFLFNRYYPGEMVSDLISMTTTGLSSFFGKCKITCDTPYLVKDRIIYGEIFTLIPIESSWCRGFMMFETSEQDLHSLINIKKEPSLKGEDGADIVESVLGEITNLSWGAFKNKYIRLGKENDMNNIHVPIYINHMKKYISFGSSDPHICFRYRLCDGTKKRVDLYQKLIFNLKWDPEEYKKESGDIKTLLEPGSFELF